MAVSRAQWVAAGLGALAADGLTAVAVEPLARRIGVTKGSFYWHFANRQDLLEAVLARWVELGTDQVIERLSAVEDPRERLRLLLLEAYELHPSGVLQALTTAGHDPVVEATLADVTERRMAFLERCYRDLGCGKAEARQWALTGYSAYVGLVHISRVAPERAREGRARRAYLTHLQEVLDPGR
jgi:AcrR family transcriptional regulator